MQKTSDQVFDEFEFRRAEALTQKRKKSKRWFRDVLSHWAPAVVCAALSVICIVGGGVVGRFDVSVISFLCFLPMCFFFVATGTFKMQQEIRELRDQVAALRGTKEEE